MEYRRVVTKKDATVENAVTFTKAELAIGGGVLIVAIVLVMRRGYGLKCGELAFLPPQQLGIELEKMLK